MLAPYRLSLRQVALTDTGRNVHHHLVSPFVLVGRMRPRSACQIVDLYHSKEHLWDVSRALHGGNTECVEEWAEAHCTDLVKWSGPVFVDT